LPVRYCLAARYFIQIDWRSDWKYIYYHMKIRCHSEKNTVASKLGNAWNVQSETRCFFCFEYDKKAWGFNKPLKRISCRLAIFLSIRDIGVKIGSQSFSISVDKLERMSTLPWNRHQKLPCKTFKIKRRFDTINPQTL